MDDLTALPTQSAAGVASRELLDRTRSLAAKFLAGLNDRPVRGRASLADLRAALDVPLAQAPLDPVAVLEELARSADPGLVATAGPRYFGFVIGGSLPAALAADWLASAWDQNAGLYAASPAAAVVEDVASAWLLDLLGLPKDARVGFVTGCQMANFSGLAAGRHAVLARVGYDVEEHGLAGAPPVHLVIGEEAHVTILASLRLLGLGSGRVLRVKADDQGRMLPNDLRRVVAGLSGPTIVCAQAGNVNTGAFDPLEEIGRITRERGAWLHIDGAFGLWAGASPRLRHLMRGAELADSWATDGHKWLNVPYDCGIVIVRDGAVLTSAMKARCGASYLIQAQGGERDSSDFTPEFSRRARGFTVYAALRSLGRNGVAEMVERCSALALRMAERLGAAPGVKILNDVVLNQVLVRFEPPGGGDADAFTDGVIAEVQRDGTCWLGGTSWHGLAAMRVSVSNWSTTEADIDRSAAAILDAARRVGIQRSRS
jgi:glutamate/tyrosine decarboxylase-like PLP-dependent enzyme